MVAAYNSKKSLGLTSAEIHRQLSGMGYALQPEQIYSAPRAMRHYLEAHQLRPYCLIHRNLEAELADLLEQPAPNAVVVGDAEERERHHALRRRGHVVQRAA